MSRVKIPFGNFGTLLPRPPPFLSEGLRALPLRIPQGTNPLTLYYVKEVLLAKFNYFIFFSYAEGIPGVPKNAKESEASDAFSG